VTEGPRRQQRSGFEDLSDLDMHAPTEAVATGRRTAILITASVVLFAGTVFALLSLVLVSRFSAETTPVSGTTVALVLVYGAVQAIAGVLVLMLVPIGRWLGIAVGAVGIVVGVIRASSSPTNGLVSILLSAFVIYALASSGPSFRRG